MIQICIFSRMSTSLPPPPFFLFLQNVSSSQYFSQYTHIQNAFFLQISNTSWLSYILNVGMCTVVESVPSNPKINYIAILESSQYGFLSIYIYNYKKTHVDWFITNRDWKKSYCLGSPKRKRAVTCTQCCMSNWSLFDYWSNNSPFVYIHVCTQYIYISFTLSEAPQ